LRVLIISDMEGVSGIANGSQTNAGEPLYEEGRKLYTQDINAAVRGARSAGATEVCVMDHHGAGGGYSFNSLIAEDLDPGCEFVVQEEWTSYSGFLEEGCDACLLVGMHAMAGTPDGVMNHTVSGQTWHNLWFNDTAVGETGINAAFCGAFGTPVTLVTGDEAACREASALLGEGLTTVSVKRGIGARSARLLVPSRARELIEAGAKRALADLGAVGPYDPGRPCEIKVEYKTTSDPAQAALKPGVELVDARTVVLRADDWLTAWRQFFF
jgi:D-amino peptidase